jgi:hypothetical protein
MRSRLQRSHGGESDRVAGLPECSPVEPLLSATEFWAQYGLTYPLPRATQPPVRLRRFCARA